MSDPTIIKFYFLLFLYKFDSLESVNIRMIGGCMTCDFTSFSTVFQSYRDYGRMISKKGCVHWNHVYGRDDFASSGTRTRDQKISRPALNPLSYARDSCKCNKYILPIQSIFAQLFKRLVTW